VLQAVGTKYHDRSRSRAVQPNQDTGNLWLCRFDDGAVCSIKSNTWQTFLTANLMLIPNRRLDHRGDWSERGASQCRCEWRVTADGGGKPRRESNETHMAVRVCRSAIWHARLVALDQPRRSRIPPFGRIVSPREAIFCFDAA